MNPTKSQVKITVLDELVTELDKAATQQATRNHETEGAIQAYKVILDKLPQVVDAIQQDTDSGVLSELVMSADHLKVSQYCIKQVQRCVNLVENLLANIERAKIVNQGRLVQTEAIMKIIALKSNDEVNRLGSFMKSIETLKSEVETDGAPHEMSEAAVDLAARKAESAKQTAEDQQRAINSGYDIIIIDPLADRPKSIMNADANNVSVEAKVALE